MMKKILVLCMFFASFLLIAGCKNTLTKADVEKMISEQKSGSSNGSGGGGGGVR
ncbi:MAG: hypothetical protein P1P65_08710 [Treponema sp.]